MGKLCDCRWASGDWAEPRIVYRRSSRASDGCHAKCDAECQLVFNSEWRSLGLMLFSCARKGDAAAFYLEKHVARCEDPLAVRQCSRISDAGPRHSPSAANPSFFKFRCRSGLYRLLCGTAFSTRHLTNPKSIRRTTSRALRSLIRTTTLRFAVVSLWFFPVSRFCFTTTTQRHDEDMRGLAGGIQRSAWALRVPDPDNNSS